MKKMGIGVAGCGSTGIQSVCQHTVFSMSASSSIQQQ